MREIKFRAWDGILDRYISWENMCKFSSIQDCIFKKEFMMEQFTGLKDKNNVEVYSNDIISDGRNKFRIYHVIGGFAIKNPYWSSDINDLRPSDQLILQPLADLQTWQWLKDNCKVIGNIHQNPELL